MSKGNETARPFSGDASSDKAKFYDLYDPLEYISIETIKESFMRGGPQAWERYYNNAPRWTSSRNVASEVFKRDPYRATDDVGVLVEVVEAIEERHNDILVVCTTREYLNWLTYMLATLCPPSAKGRYSFEYAPGFQFVCFMTEQEARYAARGRCADTVIAHPLTWEDRHMRESLIPCFARPRY